MKVPGPVDLKQAPVAWALVMVLLSGAGISNWFTWDRLQAEIRFGDSLLVTIGEVARSKQEHICSSDNQPEGGQP